MKIGFRLTLIMIILSLSVIGSIGISLLFLAQKDITELSRDKAAALTREYALEVEQFFTASWHTVQDLAHLMEQYKTVDPRSRRSLFSGLMQSTLENNEMIFGIWSVWEPDALEGNDRLYLGAEGTNDDGRFALYWYRGEDGEIDVESLDDFEIPGEDDDYYQNAKRAGRGAILEPYQDIIGDDIHILMNSITCPIFDDNGEILGIVGIDFTADEIQNITQGRAPFGSGLISVFSNEGIVASHFDEERIGLEMAETEIDVAGPYLDELIEAIAEGKSYSFSNIVDGEELYVITAPIDIGDTDTPWGLAVAVPLKTIMEPVRRMQIITLVIGLILLVLVVPVSIILSRSISEPIVGIANALKDISEGEGDLTKQLATKSKNEIGELVYYFNQTLKHISDLISKIKYKVNALTNTGYELNLNMSKTSKVVDQIAVNFDEVKVATQKQEKSAAEADVALKDIQSSIDSLNRLVEEQSESVNTSSSAIEQMTANIHSVTKTLIENSKNVLQLSEASETGKTGLETVTQKIKDIARDSEGLLEINSVMENIASQTNLLSMNAAIEAAHAGESGRGFAVVAGEIRKLAESSATQSKTTMEMLKKIKTSIDSITEFANNVLSRFEAIDFGVKTVTEHELNIRNAMEEQEEGGRQLLNSIGRLKEINISVEKGSEKMMSSGTHLITQTNDLIRNSTDVIGGMNEILNGAMMQIQTAVTHVEEMSNENTKNFNELKQETEKFKVESGLEKKKIIIVDDDEIHLEISNAMLENHYDVLTVKSGQEALQLFFQGLVPRLVLLDLIMPGLDGWNTYNRIKGISQLHNVPIAFCTASDDPKDKAHAKEIGAVDYIKKPCDDLLKRVDKILS